ncbi:MAG: phosphotransferase [Alphaproteobacteria bacterium]|nr:phosphotransferase [Alphaproteobacteria bacterium]
MSDLRPLAPDVSPRRYYRGERAGRSYILMTYPDFDETARANLQSFLKVRGWLYDNEVRVPEIIEARESEGLVLLEDLGSTSLRAAMESGVEVREAYLGAGEVLRHLKSCAPPVDLPAYKGSRIDLKHADVLRFYAPSLRGCESESALFEDYAQAWAEIEHGLPTCPQGFIHGDYHLENIMWLGHGPALERLALIDFQEALQGPLPYDLVNLLEDARADVPEDVQTGVKEMYCAGMDMDERAAFDAWYRVLGTQFHCRVIGLFIKLEQDGRAQYGVHIPRLKAYIARALREPLLAPLKRFFDDAGITF